MKVVRNRNKRCEELTYLEMLVREILEIFEFRRVFEEDVLENTLIFIFSQFPIGDYIYHDSEITHEFRRFEESIEDMKVSEIIDYMIHPELHFTAERQ